MSAPGQTYGIAPFTDHLIEATALSRVQLSMAYMFGTIGSALLLTHAGRLYDRFGARVMAPVSCLAMGGVLVILSQCDRIVRFLADLVHLEHSTALAFCLLLFGFFVLRFSGQGVLTMASKNMVMNWFDRYRGLVTGIAGMIIAPSFSAAPIVLNQLVKAWGWRGAWMLLALITGLGYAAVSALFYRDNPESCGLKPDGPMARRKGQEPKPSHTPSREFALPEARRHPAFWIFTAGLGLFGLYMTGLSFHVSSIFETSGLPRDRAFSVFLPGAAVSICLRPFVGYLADRIPLKHLLAALVTGTAISSLGLCLLNTAIGWWLIVFGNGLAGSTFGTLSAVTWPMFYGRTHMGAISGLNMSVVVFASAIGPSAFGVTRSVTGTYRGAGIACAIVAVAIIIAARWADQPVADDPSTGAHAPP
ncbi:MFS transporter [Verrucomicrobiota bacterium]